MAVPSGAARTGAAERIQPSIANTSLRKLPQVAPRQGRYFSTPDGGLMQ